MFVCECGFPPLFKCERVCVCCCCKRDCNQAASAVPRLWRVDAVLRMAGLVRYSSFGDKCLVAVHWVRAWTCDSTVPGQWGQSAVIGEPSACVSFRRFLSCLVGNLFKMTFVRKIRRCGLAGLCVSLWVCCHACVSVVLPPWEGWQAVFSFVVPCV